jgi:hypothetical protein
VGDRRTGAGPSQFAAGDRGPGQLEGRRGHREHPRTLDGDGQAGKDGVTGTPTVLVDGEALADLSPAGLTAAVTAARQ